jgi:hypothetical protein
VKDSVFQVILVLTIISYFLPLTIVLAKRLWNDLAFKLFAIYWMVNGLINIFDWIPGLSLEVQQTSGMVYNLIDIPFMLIILYISSASTQIRKFIQFTCIAFVIVEFTNVIVNGLSYESMKYVLGIGVLLVLIVILWNIVLFLRKMKYNFRQKALLFIHAALLFEYGTYIVVYIFDYFYVDTAQLDNYLIYYLSTLIAIMVACFGLLQKRETNNVAVRRERI